MSRFDEEGYKDIDHTYLTRDRLISQIRHWFPTHAIAEFIVEYDFTESATRKKKDKMPKKQLIHKPTQRYVGWFSDSHLIPYKPPLPVPPMVYRNLFIDHTPV
jgi:hypothetical protein